MEQGLERGRERRGEVEEEGTERGKGTRLGVGSGVGEANQDDCREEEKYLDGYILDFIVETGILGIFTARVLNFCSICIFHNEYVQPALKKDVKLLH